MHTNSRSAFTLMEVLAALLLLGLLVASVMPMWSRIRLAQGQIHQEAQALDLIHFLSREDVQLLYEQGSLAHGPYLLRAEALSLREADNDDIRLQANQHALYLLIRAERLSDTDLNTAAASSEPIASAVRLHFMQGELSTDNNNNAMSRTGGQ